MKKYIPEESSLWVVDNLLSCIREMYGAVSRLYNENKIDDDEFNDAEEHIVEAKLLAHQLGQILDNFYDIMREDES